MKLRTIALALAVGCLLHTAAVAGFCYFAPFWKAALTEFFLSALACFAMGLVLPKAA